MAPLPPIAGDEEEMALEEKAGLKDKLVLLIIVLVLFHIGAFVSFDHKKQFPHKTAWCVVTFGRWEGTFSFWSKSATPTQTRMQLNAHESH